MNLDQRRYTQVSMRMQTQQPAWKLRMSSWTPQRMKSTAKDTRRKGRKALLWVSLSFSALFAARRALRQAQGAEPVEVQSFSNGCKAATLADTSLRLFSVVIGYFQGRG